MSLEAWWIDPANTKPKPDHNLLTSLKGEHVTWAGVPLYIPYDARDEYVISFPPSKRADLVRVTCICLALYLSLAAACVWDLVHG